MTRRERFLVTRCRHAFVPAGLLLAVAAPAAEDRAAVDHFERHVRPVLVEHCYACHSDRLAEPQAGLRVDSRAALLEGGPNGPVVLPGDPEGSRLLQVLRHRGDVRMPPTGKLADEQVEAFAEWVRRGAPFPEGLASSDAQDPSAGQHWAFVAPRRDDPPSSSDGWADAPVDEFLEARLKQAGLGHAEDADPRTLARRLHYDLTGLPPSQATIEAFSDDPSPHAYQAMVDRLLASYRFGERWARHWLDVVRYADSGYFDNPFPNPWPYRDWVVGALNRDLPYDQFILRQLAADLLGSGRQDLPALGMLTLGINLPRPTDVPANIDDRIDVVTRGLMGLSVACAKCHDHKFDPIPQADYYALYGVFLNSPEVLEPAPIDAIPSGASAQFFTDKLAMRRAWLDRFREERLEDHKREFREPGVLARYLEVAWESRQSSNSEVETLTKEKDLNLYLLNRWRTYLSGLVGPSVEAFAELDAPGGAARIASAMAEADSLYRWPDPRKEALRLALRGNGSPTDVPIEDFWWVQNEGDSNVMKSLKVQYETVVHDWTYRGGPRHAMVVADAARLQPAHLFVRGNQHDRGAEVTRRFLSALPGPREFRMGSGRLEMARAIASPSNPLTARVLVNRVWGHLFGEGLVRTPSDFGLRGEAPSHPALLDYLASEFIDDGWSLKRLVRRLVLSRAYRQASSGTDAGSTADPENRLLWRQNRRRLDFEALRDSMLAVAGRLETAVGGVPFDLGAMPASPRRTLYARVSRERTSTLRRAFDFSNPEEHTPKRQLTTVPQQALFLMNSPFLAEQARALAKECDGAADCEERLYGKILGRQPTAGEKRRAADFLAKSREEPPVAAEPRSGESAWQHGMARLDPVAGTVSGFQPMGYRVDDRLQADAMYPSRLGGRASLTAKGGYPGDSMQNAVVRRWSAPRSMQVSIEGTLNHPMSDQARRFSYSNGVRGWIVSSRRGILASWTVRGFEAATELRKLDVAEGEHLDFVVDPFGDFESDAFRWAPSIEESLNQEQRRSGMEPQAWSAEDDFPAHAEPPLNSVEQFAQILLMTNEFAFKD